jgi:hypothetical protein
MRIGGALTSLVVRGVIFGFVVAALAPTPREAAGHLVAFTRAGLGFAASLTVTVMLMIALEAAGSSPALKTAALGLRGTI